MTFLKRCYGCNKFIWFWFKTVNTEKVGLVPKVCLVTAFENHIMGGVAFNFARTYRRERLECAIEYLNHKE